MSGKDGFPQVNVQDAHDPHWKNRAKIEFAFSGKFCNTYQRNNKKGGKKHLRCFPCCGPNHKASHACEVPVRITFSTDNLSSENSEHFIAVGRFLPLMEDGKTVSEDDITDKLGDLTEGQEISAERISTFERTNESPFLPLYRAKTSNFKKDEKRLTFEFREKAWHYGWRGGRYKQNTEHILRVYVLAGSEPLLKGGRICVSPKGVLKCVAVLSSTPFTIYSSRSVPNKAGAASPISTEQPQSPIESVPSKTDNTTEALQTISFDQTMENSDPFEFNESSSNMYDHHHNGMQQGHQSMGSSYYEDMNHHDSSLQTDNYQSHFYNEGQILQEVTSLSDNAAYYPRTKRPRHDETEEFGGMYSHMDKRANYDNGHQQHRPPYDDRYYPNQSPIDSVGSPETELECDSSDYNPAPNSQVRETSAQAHDFSFDEGPFKVQNPNSFPTRQEHTLRATESDMWNLTDLFNENQHSQMHPHPAQLHALGMSNRSVDSEIINTLGQGSNHTYDFYATQEHALETPVDSVHYYNPVQDRDMQFIYAGNKAAEVQETKNLEQPNVPNSKMNTTDKATPQKEAIEEKDEEGTFAEKSTADTLPDSRNMENLKLLQEAQEHRLRMGPTPDAPPSFENLEINDSVHASQLQVQECMTTSSSNEDVPLATAVELRHPIGSSGERQPPLQTEPRAKRAWKTFRRFNCLFLFVISALVLVILALVRASINPIPPPKVPENCMNPLNGNQVEGAKRTAFLPATFSPMSDVPPDIGPNAQRTHFGPSFLQHRPPPPPPRHRPPPPPHFGGFRGGRRLEHHGRPSGQFHQRFIHRDFDQSVRSLQGSDPNCDQQVQDYLQIMAEHNDALQKRATLMTCIWVFVPITLLSFIGFLVQCAHRRQEENREEHVSSQQIPAVIEMAEAHHPVVQAV